MECQQAPYKERKSVEAFVVITANHKGSPLNDTPSKWIFKGLQSNYSASLLQDLHGKYYQEHYYYAAFHKL